MRVTTTYKYPAGGTRNGRVYSSEVLKKAFEEPKFKHLRDTESIPVVEYEHDQVIGFATASLEDGNVTTVDASIFDPSYISAFKELSKSTDSFGFTLAGTGTADYRDDKTYITDITFDKAYVFTKDLAVDCHTTIHSINE
jgi:hypothetical protein